MIKNKKYVDKYQLAFDFDSVIKGYFETKNVCHVTELLPQLFDHQIEDVKKARAAFENSKGMLFTNGTGTGKTFVGLGVIKTFVDDGKTNIIIVVPTDPKATDWINEGQVVGLQINKLKNSNDKGKGIIVTTYANFYQNDAIEKVNWDLVVYDECHYLSQNAAGSQTVYLEKHRSIANLPRTCLNKAGEIIGDPPIDHRSPTFYEDVQKWKKDRLELAEELASSTKVLMLSATPFAYHKSVEYADGCLWQIVENFDDQNDYSSYNEAGGFDTFMCNSFGYRMKYNKLTIPEHGVDQNLMERNFFESWKEKGLISTRQLDLDYDYSRDFFIIDSDIGNYINEGMELFYQKEFTEEFKYLAKFAEKKWNYLFINQLLECIKAQEIGSRIQKHLDLGRKVVVFHSYNNSTVPHPFKFEAYDLLTQDEYYLEGEVSREIRRFEEKYPHLINMDLSHLKNSRDAICDLFPMALQFNGKVPKKKRSKNVELFNNDYSNCDIIICQQKAAREGISLHDKTGFKQRVSINLGLPTEPTAAIQIEGRTYRSGLKSDAVYEYPTVQTSFERRAFATKIATRSKTAENLAMGNLARDLETAFKEGYINASYFEPSLTQGTGGKKADKSTANYSEFDRAKTYYWSRAKKTTKNKSSEGIDFYATPEPLGYKMVEWLAPLPDDKGLEPSCGNGAIGRFFPAHCNNKFVEPSHKLFSSMGLNVHGECYNERFEDFHTVNKANFIAMNPPFGVGGSTAIEHLKKALVHMNRGNARLACIVPNGSSMNKRLDQLFESKDFEENYIMQGQIFLPDCTFERAATNVSCKIIFISSKKGNRQYSTYYFEHDLTHLTTIERFFERIESLEINV